MTTKPATTSSEFDREVQLLRGSRPTLTSLELDALYRRIHHQADARRRFGFMRTRGALTAILASGVLLTGGSTAAGISGLALNGSASVAQYGSPGALQGVKATSAKPTNVKATSIAPATGQAAPVALQTSQQATTSSAGTLPFTGYAIFPVLLIGLGLVAVGVIGRRRLKLPEGTAGR